MKCPKCNANILDDSKFCVHCGTKIEAAMENMPDTELITKCINCGAPLKPGAKFCPKCGTAQNMQAGQNTQTGQNMKTTQNTQTGQKVQDKPKKEKAAGRSKKKEAAVQQPPKKKSKLPVVILAILLAIAVIAAGGYFVLTYVFDVNPIEMVQELLDKGEENDEAEEIEGEDKDNKEDEDVTEENEKGDPELLDALDDQLEAAQQLFDGGSYLEAIEESKNLIDQYVEIAENNGLEEEANEKIADAFEIASKAAIESSRGIEAQNLGSAAYTQVTGTVDPVIELASSLTEKGYTVDSDEITEYSDGIVSRFKDFFIDAINEITEREQWSRDEAWTYAEQAYSIQKEGKPLLFGDGELDDPMRLRYIYCLAWISRKRCENGVADGSMTKEDAFNAMTAVLEETDYNLLVLQDIITYGSETGKDVSGYQNAYNAIIQEIKDEQNLSVVNSGVNSVTSVDVRKFWYFNDLDGEDAYKVDINNGTTQRTREWIRNNIPSYIG